MFDVRIKSKHEELVLDEPEAILIEKAEDTKDENVFTRIKSKVFVIGFDLHYNDIEKCYFISRERKREKENEEDEDEDEVVEVEWYILPEMFEPVGVYDKPGLFIN